MNPLQSRLAAVRRRLRLVVAFRGVCWLVSLLFLSVILACLLDVRFHLFPVVRALLLAGIVGGCAWLALRLLIRPLRDRTDDLSLALRVEKIYPALNDSLASTVQFLQGSRGEGSDSPSLKREAVARALKKVQHCDFSRVVDARGLIPSAVCLMVACGVVLLLALLLPGPALTALERLANPYGAADWPPRTRIQHIDAPVRLAEGQPFVFQARLEGEIPEQARIVYQVEGASAIEQSFPVERQEKIGTLSGRLEAARIRKSFRYQILANDGASAWKEVSVLPPPQLTALGGRPSPQIALQYPPYTELPAKALPDGAVSVKAVAGTKLSLKAATSRPVDPAQTWLEYQPDESMKGAVAAIAPLTGLERIPVRVTAAPGGSGSLLELQFTPWLSGAYALHFADHSGLGNTRLLDIRVLVDRAPNVALERPSSLLDSLTLLPDAQFTLQARVDDIHEDQTFAVRSCYLEYHTQKNEPPRRLVLYDFRIVGPIAPSLLSSLGAGPIPIPAPATRPQRLLLSQRIAVKQLHHADGAPLKDGDAVTLQLCADDFDDVTSFKQPGRSHEVELRIVSRAFLEAMLSQQEAQVQQELLRLREQEREALKKTDPAEKQWRFTGRLRGQDIDNLLEVEKQQQNLLARIGNEKEGLRADVGRILQAIRDNNLGRSSTQERMEMVARELDRLTEEELEPIEPLLAKARQENEDAPEPRKPDKDGKGSLSKALRHQEEVEKSLSDLLSRLEPNSSMRQFNAATKATLQEQRRLNDRTENLQDAIPFGAKPENLKPEERARLEETAQQQKMIHDRLTQLLEDMDRTAAERSKQAEEKRTLAKERERLAEDKKQQARALQNKDRKEAQRLQEEAEALEREAQGLREAADAMQAEAKALREAASLGRKDRTDGQPTLRKAGQSIRDNQLNQATGQQKQATQTLEQMAKALEDRREEELDKLIKNLRDKERRLEELIDKQEELQKKSREAAKIADPAEREKELARLAREQEKLRKDAQDLGRELARLRAERAGQALSRAGSRMEDANEEMNRGGDPGDRQDDVLDRLDEAQRELEQARKEVEDQLAREKMAKVADLIARIKERQESLQSAGSELQRDLLQRKAWDNGLLSRLTGLSDAQSGLADEADNLAEGPLANALVFARMVQRAANAMKEAAESMLDRRGGIKIPAERELDVKAETAADETTQNLQREAKKRLELLTDALKNEMDRLGRPQQPPAGQPGEGGDMGGGNQRGGADGIPYLAQLKVLRELQQEVNGRTKEFAEKHPDPARLTAKEKALLDALQQDQREITELLEQLTAPPPEGGKP